ncbi:MAG: lysophospholipase [Proteobacteria bacterium]|nr:lysophospholipase [Pseudomonadota bacterium]MBI3498448.1 lysophospholipase [Pseudomonadota bacterium]
MVNLLGAGALVALAACAPQRTEPGPGAAAAALASDHFLTEDGLALPMDVWRPAGKSWAVALALHGMNDYRRAFAELAGEMSERGVTVYAYDQRGFGAAPGHGLWPGSEALIADLNAALRLVRQRHPELPLTLIGESMSGAVVLADLAQASIDPPNAAAMTKPDGIVLIAPAVWGGPALGAVPIGAAWLMANTLPWFLLYAELGIQPSDNITMLRRYSGDSLVIRRTRADAVYGLVELMGQAQAAAPHLQGPALIIYGGRDQIIPRRAVCSVIRTLPDAPAGDWRVAFYPEGHHMITRDLAGRGVAEDLLAWMADHATPLPSATEIANAHAAGAGPALRAAGLCRG